MDYECEGKSARDSVINLETHELRIVREVSFRFDSEVLKNEIFSNLPNPEVVAIGALISYLSGKEIIGVESSLCTAGAIIIRAFYKSFTSEERHVMQKVLKDADPPPGPLGDAFREYNRACKNGEWFQAGLTGKMILGVLGELPRQRGL